MIFIMQLSNFVVWRKYDEILQNKEGKSKNK